MRDIKDDDILELVTMPIPILREELFPTLSVFVRNCRASIHLASRETNFAATIEDEYIFEWDVCRRCYSVDFLESGWDVLF